MWGIIPAAGAGTRIQPLAFSKELLPMCGGTGADSRRPRAVSDYLVERLVLGGATKICFVISAGKSDILEYYGGAAHSVPVCYTVQPKPVGLCDAIFRALPVIDKDAPVLIGLPDTIWFPEDALKALPDDSLSLLLFPVQRPELFDAVQLDANNQVVRIEVKKASPSSNWVWGALKIPGLVLEQLHEFWLQRGKTDEYIGTLINAWLAEGGLAHGFRLGNKYFDVGTMSGYLEAMRMLSESDGETASVAAVVP